MTKNQRSVLVTVIIFVLCLAMVAAGTYALFSSDANIKNHLQAGKLDVTLTRTKLTTYSLNDKGELAETVSDEIVDFSEVTERNVFDVDGDVLFVPLCRYSAEMQIKNNGNVTFGYWIEVEYDNETYIALADQIMVTITTAGGSINEKLSDCRGFIGSSGNPIGILDEYETADFTISIEFLDLKGEENNEAKASRVDFDVLVYAVQIVEDAEKD